MAIDQMLAVFDQNVGTVEVTGDTTADTNEFVVVLGKDGKQLIMRTPRSTDEDEE